MLRPNTPKSSKSAVPIVAEVMRFKKFELLDANKALIKESDVRLTQRKKRQKL